MVFSNNLLMGAAGQATGYEIEQSIRFDNVNGVDAGGAQMFRLALTGTPTNTKKATISAWVKRATLGFNQTIAYAGDPNGSTTESIRFDTADTLSFQQASSDYVLTTTQVFRDIGAWYHIVAEIDTANGTSADRANLYVNGTKVTSFSTESYPTQDYVTNWTASSSSIAHTWGTNGIPSAGPSSQLFAGYMAEMFVLDGEKAGASSFGETNNDGVWVPIKYSGSFGNNGYYMTGETASALGDDFSGNSLDFTTVALATTDQMLDTPTLNKATLNVLNLHSTGSVLSDGNLTVTNSGTSGFWHRSYATQALSYKTYWEVHADNLGSLNMGVSSLGNVPGGVNNPAGNKAAGIQNNEAFVTGSYANESSGSRTFPISTGDYVMLAFDPARGALWMGTEGTWKDGTASSASSSTILAEIEGSGTSYAIFTGIDADDAIPMIAQYSTSVATSRFSSGDWEGTAPTGYEELSTAFIATPTISDGSKYFQSTLYSGNGSTQSINQSGNSTFQPDWVWIKNRDAADSHVLTDSPRGVTKILSTNNTDAETTDADTVTAFESDGFALGDDDKVNTSSESYVAWQWHTQGAAGSSNTDGSINTTTTSLNTTAGFSISTYTGTGSAATIGHGLGVTPSMIFVKKRDSGSDDAWVVWHTKLPGANYYLNLNDSGAQDTSVNYWNNTLPTSSVFSVGASNGTNQSTKTFVAYCFAEIPGYSSIGSFTGNGNADGPFVFTGFKPAFIIFKVSTNAPTGWIMLDNKRDTFNAVNHVLQPNDNGAENSGGDFWDFLSNGFKVRSTWAAANGSGYTVTYIAFAEHPFGGDGVAPATAR